MADLEKLAPSQVKWRPRWNWLKIDFVFIVLAPVVIIFVCFWLAMPALGWGDEASRPLKYPRDEEMMERIVDWVHKHGDCHEYYVDLPNEFAAFTAGGAVSCWEEEVFLPQWSGIPDDAGGFWYCPDRSPAGNDMWGMICRNPVDLGDGWWTCGMGS